MQFRLACRIEACGTIVSSPPRDCVLQIVAKGHARRKTDSANYPSLERLNFLYTNHGDVDAYLQADPAEVLSYILDDLATALSFNLVDKTADGLAMLVSQLTQAAISQVPGGYSLCRFAPTNARRWPALQLHKICSATHGCPSGWGGRFRPGSVMEDKEGHFCAGEKMKEIEGILAVLVAAFAKQANTTVARTLTPAASLSLRAAQFALAAVK